MTKQQYIEQIKAEIELASADKSISLEALREILEETVEDAQSRLDALEEVGEVE